LKKMSITPTISLLINPKFPSCNSLLIEDKRVALIDTGLGIDWIRKILKEIEIDILINSHTHPDHAAANYIISGITSAQIYVPEQEKGNTKSLDDMKKKLGVWGKYIEPSWDKIILEGTGFKESERETPFGEGHIFDLGKTQLEAVHTPGHSPGHFCFLIRDQELFFASDLGLDSFGPWYGYLDSNISQYLYTIEKVRKIKIKRTISSHFDNVIHNLDKELNRCLEIIGNRENKIVELLKEQQRDISDLSKYGIIYRNLNNFQGPMREFWTFFEENMIKKHLRVLIGSDKVKEENGYYITL